jgi:hypothetical protein
MINRNIFMSRKQTSYAGSARHPKPVRPYKEDQSRNKMRHKKGLVGFWADIKIPAHALKHGSKASKHLRRSGRMR